MATLRHISLINRCASAVFVLCMWLSCLNALRLPHLQLTKQDIVTIQIKSNDRHKRSADTFPFDIEANFSSSNGIYNINLHRIDDVIDDVPVVLNHAGKLRSYKVIDPQKVAYYDDRAQEAVFMVWERPMAGDGSGAQSFDFFGTFVTHKTQFLVQPRDHATGSHTLAPVKDVLPTETDFLVNPTFDRDLLEKTMSNISETSGEHFRNKRQSTAYEVELFFVIDFSLYSFWYSQTTGTEASRKSQTLSTIKQFYAFVLSSMNIRYESVTGSGYSISLRYAGIYIAETTAAAPFIEDNLLAFQVNGRKTYLASTVLGTFRNWANVNLANNYNYDHAIMFSNYEMGQAPIGTFEESTAGLAYTPGACESYRYSIVEDKFETIIATVAAHELGHNLNAQHDATGNACADDKFVMSPSTSISEDQTLTRNQFLFSSCSISYFTGYIATLNSNNNNCLSTRTANYDTSDLDPYLSHLAGQVYPPDTQCQYIQGAGSALYRGYYNYNYSSICTLLSCIIPDTSSYSYHLSWDGTTCGSGKICMAGQCIASASGPSITDERCAFGNTPGNLLGTPVTTCAAIVGSTATSYNCYQDYYREQCCATCEQYRLAYINITDCTYGDKASWCSSLSLSGCYSNAGQCCQSCPARALSIPNCPYGDRASGCDVTLCPSYTENTRTVGCCLTCAPATTTTATTTTTTAATTTTTAATTTTTAAHTTTTAIPTTSIAAPTTTTAAPATSTAAPSTSTPAPTTTTAAPTNSTAAPTTSTAAPTTTTAAPSTIPAASTSTTPATTTTTAAQTTTTAAPTTTLSARTTTTAVTATSTAAPTTTTAANTTTAVATTTKAATTTTTAATTTTTAATTTSTTTSTTIVTTTTITTTAAPTTTTAATTTATSTPNTTTAGSTTPTAAPITTTAAPTTTTTAALTTTTAAPTITTAVPTTTTAAPTTSTAVPTTTTASSTAKTVASTITTAAPTTTAAASTTTTATLTTKTAASTTRTSAPISATAAPTTTTSAPTTTTASPTTTTNIPTRTTWITVRFPVNTTNINFDDPFSISIRNLKIDLRNQLLLVYRNMGRRVRDIVIINLRRGSLVATYEVIYEDTPESAIELTHATLRIVSGNQTVTILNETVPATSVQVNETIVTKETLSENVCHLFVATRGCGQGFHCENQDGKPVCVRDETKDGLTVVIITTVCSVVVLFIITIFVCIVARFCRNKKADSKKLSTFCSSDESQWKDIPNSITPYLGYSNWRDRAIGNAPYPRSAFVHGNRSKGPYSAAVYGDHLPSEYGPNESSTRGSEHRPYVVSVDFPDHLRKSYDNAAFKSEGHLGYRKQ
ncbi:streptococcal hemagglutinin-like isoform X2 [Dreissena polymorpha]|nr:streptococcal hemagglutinin-like isoform X2 [Dreissena polymorpha]